MCVDDGSQTSAYVRACFAENMASIAALYAASPVQTATCGGDVGESGGRCHSIPICSSLHLIPPTPPIADSATFYLSTYRAC